MRLFNFQKFISEKNQIEEPIFDDLKDELKKLIQKSLKTSDEKTMKDFISSYSNDQEKNQIEGLINDSDVYEFYLKFRNQIDEILSTIDFYEKKPSELNSFSLYDYLINGTKRAIKEAITSIKNI